VECGHTGSDDTQRDRWREMWCGRKRNAGLMLANTPELAEHTRTQDRNLNRGVASPLRRRGGLTGADYHVSGIQKDCRLNLWPPIEQYNLRRCCSAEKPNSKHPLHRCSVVVNSQTQPTYHICPRLSATGYGTQLQRRCKDPARPKGSFAGGLGRLQHMSLNSLA